MLLNKVAVSPSPMFIIYIETFKGLFIILLDKKHFRFMIEAYTVTIPTFSMFNKMVLCPKSCAVDWKLGSFVFD